MSTLQALAWKAVCHLWLRFVTRVQQRLTGRPRLNLRCQWMHYQRRNIYAIWIWELLSQLKQLKASHVTQQPSLCSQHTWHQRTNQQQRASQKNYHSHWTTCQQHWRKQSHQQQQQHFQHRNKSHHQHWWNLNQMANQPHFQHWSRSNNHHRSTHKHCRMKKQLDLQHQSI